MLKQIEVQAEFVCDFTRQGNVLAKYVISKLMLADLLTEALDSPKPPTMDGLLQLN